MLLVVPVKPFVSKLKDLAELPENSFDAVRLHGDLTLVPKDTLEKMGPLGAVIKKTVFSAPDNFNPVQEFFAALNTLESEIRCNDFELLRNPDARNYLPQVMIRLNTMVRKYVAIGDHTTDLSLKCVNLKIFISSHTPLILGPDAAPIFPRDYLQQFDKHPLSDYPAILGTDDTTVEKMTRLIALANQMSSVPENISNQLKQLTSQMVYRLFELPALNPRQREFADLLFRNPRFNNRSYTSVFWFGRDLEERLKSCRKSYDSPQVKLATFHAICTVAQRFDSYVTEKRESPFDRPDVRPFVNFSPTDFRMKDFEREKKKLMKFLLPYLPVLIENPESKEMLKVVFLYKGHREEPASILLDLVRELENQDYCANNQEQAKGKEGEKKAYKFKEISRLHNAGFLVPDGDNLRISDAWCKIMDALVPDHECFLFEAFELFETLPKGHPKHDYYLRFLKGPSVLRYPRYFVQKAFCVHKVEGEECLIQRMLTLTGQQTQELKAMMEDIRPEVSYAKLVLASKQAGNLAYVDTCYRMLGKRLVDYLYEHNLTKELPPFDVPDDILVEAVKHLNLAAEEKEHKGLVYLDVKLFPKLTHVGLSAIIKKCPQLDIKNIDVHKESAVADITLTDGKNKLYMNSEVLKRSSEYFRGLLEGGFKESAPQKERQLSPEEFEFMRRWELVIHQPTDNFLVRNMGNFQELNNRLKDTPQFYLSQIACAHQLQMDSLFHMLDRIYTHLITPVGEDEATQARIRRECLNFKATLGLPANHTASLLMDTIKGSQFHMRMETIH